MKLEITKEQCLAHAKAEGDAEVSAGLLAADPVTQLPVIKEAIEALRAAQALATCCAATNCYSRDELAELAVATGQKFTAILAKLEDSDHEC